MPQMVNPQSLVSQQNPVNNFGYYYHPQFIQQPQIPAQQSVQSNILDEWYYDLMGDKEPKVSIKAPSQPQLPAVIKEDNITQQIDSLIDQLKNTSKQQEEKVEYGIPRFGTESMDKLTNKELISNCLKEAISVYPGVSFNLALNAYGLFDLSIFYNGQMVDRFMVDQCNKYGRGVPVLYDGRLMKIDPAGIPSVLPNTVAIPLGSILAIRQNLFRNIPSNPMNFLGTTADVYQESMSHLLDQQVYYMLDLSAETLPDDEENYKKFGEKIKAINEIYPLVARYRLYKYKNNDSFMLISDLLVKPYSVFNDPRTHTDTSIIVNGDILTITEPDNNKKIINIRSK